MTVTTPAVGGIPYSSPVNKASASRIGQAGDWWQKGVCRRTNCRIQKGEEERVESELEKCALEGCKPAIDHLGGTNHPSRSPLNVPATENDGVASAGRAIDRNVPSSSERTVAPGFITPSDH